MVGDAPDLVLLVSLSTQLEKLFMVPVEVSEIGKL